MYLFGAALAFLAAETLLPLLGVSRLLLITLLLVTICLLLLSNSKRIRAALGVWVVVLLALSLWNETESRFIQAYKYRGDYASTSGHEQQGYQSVFNR